MLLYRKHMEKKTYKQFKKEILKNKEIKQAYERLGPAKLKISLAEK